MNHHLKIFLCKVFTNKKLTSKLILFIQKPDFITLYQCRITVLKSLEGRRKHKRMISVYYACKICSRLCVAYIIAGTGHTFTSENRIIHCSFCLYTYKVIRAISFCIAQPVSMSTIPS